jgi:hypothetical protein
LNSQEWHAKCNNFGATLTLFELINGMRLAIFLPDSMYGNRAWRRYSKNALLFTVNGEGKALRFPNAHRVSPLPLEGHEYRPKFITSP